MTINLQRKTQETAIELELSIAGSDEVSISESCINTGLPFFDHMLTQLAFHADWVLRLTARGDLAVDDHHLIEDVAIVLGDALVDARRQHARSARINRYGQRLLPMDGTLVLCAVDLDGRGTAVIHLPFTREQMGGIAAEMWPHFFKTLSAHGQFSLHLQAMNVDNNHHLIEAGFKALARALAEALTINESNDIRNGVEVNRVPSTKGCL